MNKIKAITYTICHITTIHPALDNRIFNKELRSLAAKGYNTILLAGNAESFEKDGVKVIGVPCKYKGQIERFRKLGPALFKAARKLDADIYHFHDPEFLWSAYKLKRLGKRVIYDVHEDIPRQLMGKHYLPSWLKTPLSKSVEALENKLAGKFDGIITATDTIKDRFKHKQTNICTIFNYPRLEELFPEGASLDDNTASSKASSPKEITYIGSISKVRGIVELVKALEYCDCILNLGGVFSPASLQEDVSKLPGWKKVKFYGFADRPLVKELFSRSSLGIVTLHPIINYLDALPVKMFEYMAAGLPVLTSDVPLWKSIVEENGCGVAVDPYDPKDIAKGISKLLKDEHLCQKMATNGRLAVESKFNWQSEEKKLVQFYQNILSK